MLEPTFLNLPEFTLTGISTEMSLSSNKTQSLWSSFRRQQKQSKYQDPDFFYSVIVYPENYFENFNPATPFVKHALVSTEHTGNLDLGWERFTLPGGLYAVFNHKGPDSSIFNFIYNQWLPQSRYILDNRPHFEKLPAGYIPGHSESEEEIYIPIKAV
ncbi:MAG: GyrI-like domain-containing protein [Bacteroidetes bacterium]|nr:GyrI-like domain-containing protein [Bacteroidota bacterium]